MLSLIALSLVTPQIALDAGVALTMDDRHVIHNARILISASGNIESLGRQSDVAIPEGYQHLSFPESFVWPGGVDLHSHTQTGGWGDINDMVHPDNPELRTLDTIRANNQLHQVGRAGGVTMVNAIPGSGTNISGAGTLVQLVNSSHVEDVVYKYPGSVKVAQGYNPERGDDLGASRMGMWWMLRWYLDRADEIAQADTLAKHPDMASIAGIFQKKHPFLVHTAGARDTYGTVRMFQIEAGVPVIVSHGSFNGFAVGKELAAVNARLNIGPRNFDFSVAKNAQIRGLVEAYESAGNTDISIQTDASVIPQEEYVYQATLAERLGCSTWIALESINVRPASQIQIDDRLGRLAVGLRADLVVSSGQPLDPRAAVEIVMISGEVVYNISDGQMY
ncbi:MAG: amidohydrolase family protein [Planctomycetota bacterium]|nr:amidohydrolase family protein [Planctomycetota bacterium]